MCLKASHIFCLLHVKESNLKKFSVHSNKKMQYNYIITLANYIIAFVTEQVSH